MYRPLEGLRIVSVEQYGAGPFGSMYLADLGAEVIKIENPTGGGDVSRLTGPWFLGKDDSEFFQTFNRSKRSLTLDLKAPGGREVFERLVGTADAVLNNLRGDQPAKLGLTYEALHKVNPKIVCAHLSAYGRVGPRAAWPGYDYLMQAEAGFMSLTGDPDAPPTRFGLSMVDFITGITAALGLVSAVMGARATGKGADVDVSLFETALHQLTYPATWYLNRNDETKRLPRSAHPSTVPCEVMPSKDGWVFIMCMTPKFWENLVRIAGAPELASDPRFIDAKARRKNRVVLETVLDPIFKTKTTAEWVDALSGHVPVAPIYTLAEALDNPYLQEVGMIEDYEHASEGPFRMVASPIRVNGERLTAKAAPQLGADTDDILSSLGYEATEIAALKASKTI